jgi:UPF0271 protein
VTIEISADMGEGAAAEPEIWPLIDAANVACGGHAGDAQSMREASRRAREHGVAIGAHPSYPDRANFGRTSMKMDPAALRETLIEQISALAAITPLRHVKAHGALYNMAARDRRLADAIARAIKAVDPALIMFGLPTSLMIDAGIAAGLRVAAEGFADRAYEPDGSLTPRSRKGAVIHDPALVVDRAIRMVREGIVLTTGGQEIPLKIDTICVHGDTPGAPDLTRRIRAGLEAAGVQVRSL